jgi:hypothetical protein
MLVPPIQSLLEIESFNPEGVIVKDEPKWRLITVRSMFFPVIH